MTKSLMSESFSVVKSQNSLMSAFLCGNCTLAEHHEKCLVPAFIKGPVNHLFGILH